MAVDIKNLILLFLVLFLTVTDCYRKCYSAPKKPIRSKPSSPFDFISANEIR